MTNSNTDTNAGSQRIIRIFYAFLTLCFGVLVAWFVYQNVTFTNPSHPFKLGLDLAGGSHLVYEADVSGVAAADVPDLMNVLRDVIERRVNIFGVSEPIVQVERSSFVSDETHERLVVELPGVTDVAQAVAAIGETPLLEFKLIEPVPADAATSTGTSSASDITFVDTGLTGRYLESAQLQFAGQTSQGGLANEPIVAITFNEEGATLFEDITRAHTGEELAIFLDGTVISAPRINEAITGGKAVISGNFDPEEARSLAQNLSFGALPVPITLISTQTIGATLGGEVLNKGVFAGLVGLGLVIAFMLFWYRLPGVVATAALLMYVVVMLALFQLIPVTLTAAGLAGFVLSLGMAVDANVLVFERMKEEYRSGKDSRESATIGFSRAWSAIRDGNITSLLSAIILFWFGTSMVKGFALVFGMGVIVSMLTALLVTRTLLIALPSIRLREHTMGWLFNSGIKK